MQKLLLGDPVSEYLDNKSSMIFENYEREEGKKATLGAITVGAVSYTHLTLPTIYSV